MTVGVNIASTAIVMTHAIPDSYADLGMLVNAIIANVMTSLVYRQLKLGRFSDNHSTLPTGNAVSTVVFRSRIPDHGSAPDGSAVNRSQATALFPVAVECKSDKEKECTSSAGSMGSGDDM